MNVHETTGEIMNEVDWKKDGEIGCLMSLVKVGAITVVMATVLILAYTNAPALLDLVW
jgi:hypothetical protein